jgi:hypothetical protein
VAQFDPAKGTTKVWILQYAYHRAINRRQHLNVRQFYDQTSMDEVEAHLTDTAPTLGGFAPDELKHLLRQGLATLNSAQKRVVELVSYDGLSMQEIANKTGDTLVNVRHHYYRGLQLLDESRNQEKLLADARDEAARISQLRVNDEATLAQEQLRIADLSNRLRVANATIDMERQLAAQGKDVRELMASRELHVIDVRDTDPNGNPGKAFGRVFLTEGKSLTFYGFDLNEGGVLNAKSSFQVWAVPEGNMNSSRSLGILRQDPKAQGRWVLNVANPELVKDINSVFVTVEPAAGGKQPSGQKMLYAYLGPTNHP